MCLFVCLCVTMCLFVCDYVSCAACICKCGAPNPDTKWGRRSVLTAIHTRVVHAFGVGKVFCFDHARLLIPVVFRSKSVRSKSDDVILVLAYRLN